MHTRTIPSSGQAIPVIGLGTYPMFDVTLGAANRAPLETVMRTLFEAGGRLVDSSPMYGKSEQVCGQLLDENRWRDTCFVATKVWTTGEARGQAEMRNSLKHFRRDSLDLMQIHNLSDWRTQLNSARALQAKGVFRYVGITHYTSSAFDDVESVLRAEQLDFLQINYSVAEPEAARTLLPLCQERGIAVLINRPLGKGAPLRKARSKPLPPVAAELGCTSWAQLLLKFVVGHPAVTCAIPATGNPDHMADNVKAGMGVLPDAKQCAAILKTLSV
ncbi:MAG: aldo/keto reductase [Alphaproteobacteria bacterium]